MRRNYVKLVHGLKQMADYKKVFHTTKLGVKSMIDSEGWIVSNNSPHCAFYGRGIYFWELESDAHRLGRFWYGKDYEIVSETLPFLSNFIIINRDIPPIEKPDFFSRHFLSKGINMLVIPQAYLNHKAKIEALGCSYVWLVDLPPSGIVRIRFGF
jgi:hypothetical protein